MVIPELAKDWGETDVGPRTLDAVVFFGPPGAGKTTIGTLVEERLEGHLLIPPGELFRTLDPEVDEYGQWVSPYRVRPGSSSIPTFLRTEIVREFIKYLQAEKDYNPGTDILILDSFPKKPGELRYLPFFDIQKVILFEVSRKTALKRITEGRYFERGRADDADPRYVSSRIRRYGQTRKRLLYTLIDGDDQIFPINAEEEAEDVFCAVMDGLMGRRRPRSNVVNKKQRDYSRGLKRA